MVGIHAYEVCTRGCMYACCLRRRVYCTGGGSGGGRGCFQMLPRAILLKRGKRETRDIQAHFSLAWRVRACSRRQQRPVDLTFSVSRQSGTAHLNYPPRLNPSLPLPPPPPAFRLEFAPTVSTKPFTPSRAHASPPEARKQEIVCTYNTTLASRS